MTTLSKNKVKTNWWHKWRLWSPFDDPSNDTDDTMTAQVTTPDDILTTHSEGMKWPDIFKWRQLTTSDVIERLSCWLFISKVQSCLSCCVTSQRFLGSHAKMRRIALWGSHSKMRRTVLCLRITLVPSKNPNENPSLPPPHPYLCSL